MIPQPVRRLVRVRHATLMRRGEGIVRRPEGGRPAVDLAFPADQGGQDVARPTRAASINSNPQSIFTDNATARLRACLHFLLWRGRLVVSHRVAWCVFLCQRVAGSEREGVVKRHTQRRRRAVR
jgi:hypothetical protein